VLFSCSKPLYVESTNPDFLLGKWVAKQSSVPAQDMVLNFFSSGRYNYSISRMVDSLTSDTSYWERGNWNVTFADLNHNKIYDNNSEENHLFTNAEASSVQANVGQETYSMFEYSTSEGREFLKLSADSGVVIATFEKDTAQ
jgi:hypothetical protein